MNYEPRLQNPPVPQAASTVFYTFGDDQEVLAAGVRPAPLSEVRKQDGVQRHLGISYELVQALDVPALQIGEEVGEVPMDASRNRLLQKFLRQQQVTVQEIPAVRHRFLKREASTAAHRRENCEPSSSSNFRASCEADRRYPCTFKWPNFGANCGADRRYSSSSCSNFRSEFRSRSSMLFLGRLGEALLALQLPRQQLRSAQMTGIFSHFSLEENKCEDWAAVECEPAVALETVHGGDL